MGRPLNGTLRVEELNASIRQVVTPGTPTASIPRPKWDRILLKHYGIGIEMAQNLTRTGEALGYWQREAGQAGGPDGGRKPGVVRILPDDAPSTSPGQPPRHPAAPGSPAAAATTSPQGVTA